MTINRRTAIAAGTGAVALAMMGGTALAVDNTATLQAQINAAATGSGVVSLAAGTYSVTTLYINSTITFEGVPGKTILLSLNGARQLEINGAADVTVSGVIFDGQNLVPAVGAGGAGGSSDADGQYQLLAYQCPDITVEKCIFRNAVTCGVGMDACTGRITNNKFHDLGQAAILAGRFYGTYQSFVYGTHTLLVRGMTVSGNHIYKIANNGIVIKHSAAVSEEDSSIITDNHIEGVRSGSGDGQHGNGIYVFASDNVVVSDNRISDTDYSGIRNTSSKFVQITGNMISRSTEVAIFVEFAFETCVVDSNIIENAFCGIELSGGGSSVGANGVISNNIVRNINRSTLNPSAKKSIGINCTSINTVAIGNVVETVGTNTYGPGIGMLVQDWTSSHYHSVQDNMIKGAPIGIGVVLGSGNAVGAKKISVTGNTIVGPAGNYIRLVDPAGASFVPFGTDQTVTNTYPGTLFLANNVTLT
jgi:uncharacterized secreted repeat protein (TIGR03808 family)